MGTSPYFTNYTMTSEQRLLEDLVVESIRIYGQDMYYMPYTHRSFDDIFGEDDLMQYNSAHLMEFYIKSTDGFQGEGNLYTTYGLEIRDRVIFTVARRAFMDEIGVPMELPRPREHDLIYFPLNKKCFKIMFVEDKAFFYQLGSLPMYDLYCELFEYSNEEFNTGIPEIDEIQQKHSTNVIDFALLDENGNYFVDEHGNVLVTEKWAPEEFNPLDDTVPIQEHSDSFIDFSEIDPFTERKDGRF